MFYKSAVSLTRKVCKRDIGIVFVAMAHPPKNVKSKLFSCFEVIFRFDIWNTCKIYCTLKISSCWNLFGLTLCKLERHVPQFVAFGYIVAQWLLYCK